MRHIIALMVIFQVFICTEEYRLSLGDFGSVHYLYEGKLLLHIDRCSSSQELMYRHSYHYDVNGQLVSETLIRGLGEIVYSKPGVVISPYHREICEYDEQGNLIKQMQDGRVEEYAYNDLNELITAENSSEPCEYDLAGNVIRMAGVWFSYDQNNRLVKASADGYEVTYTYDDLGRRTSKTVNGEQEFYALFGFNEVMVFDHNGIMKELRIPGLSIHKDVVKPIAIETRDAVYAPIHSIQGNIVKLVDAQTREVIPLAAGDPFGQGLSQEAPTSWIFSGKYYDKELNLVYFGHRYYSPKLKKWLSPDPACQTPDLYQYCMNNPLSYFDPDGQFVFVIPLIWVGGVTLGELLLDGAVIAGVGWATHEAVKKGNEWADKREMQRKKMGNVDPTLPKDPFKDSRLQDISHPDAKARGHYQFKDKKTGRILEYDKGKPGRTGHKGHDHYHRPNPNASGKHDNYLDGAGRPVPEGSEASHLYHPDSVWWK
ncbi:MAG: RHS repeat-associated core domain-containing protein [Chlamydiae bacterium]|nr:RHS repeat-associated core domain-containing protein [Chlamydiota bacterium]